jgi:hypothetical protein
MRDSLPLKQILEVEQNDITALNTPPHPEIIKQQQGTNEKVYQNMLLEYQELPSDFQEMQHMLEEELGRDTSLARDYMHGLYCISGGSLEKAGEKFFEIGKLWAPLIQHWSKWIKEKVEDIPPKIIMRDAKILLQIPECKDWNQIWINRTILGIADELSGDHQKEVDALLMDYLSQNALDVPFAFVDSGCWGTVVVELHRKLQEKIKNTDHKLRFYPVFFYSHNPYIPGFLNELGISTEEAEILNDSLECCFINTIHRPKQFSRENGKVQPHMEQTQNKLITVCATSALSGVTEGIKEIPLIEANQAVEQLITLSHKAKKSNMFTGILPNHSPTWSRGKKFIESWPEDLNWTNYTGPKLPL